MLPFARGFALSGYLKALRAAGVGFAVESLRNRGRTANLTEKQDFDFKFAAFIGDAQHVSDPHVARRLGGNLSVGLNSPEFTGAGREGSRLEEARGPEPFVNANG